MTPTMFMFQRLGQVIVSVDVDADDPDLEDKLFEIGLSHGANDLPDISERRQDGVKIYEVRRDLEFCFSSLRTSM